MKARGLLSNDDGMMLMQVVLSSVVMLAVLLTGFKTVRSTIEMANTAATSSEFKDLVLSIEQQLSVSETCGPRLGIPAAGLPLNTVKNASDGFPVQILSAPPPAGAAYYMEEKALSAKSTTYVGYHSTAFSLKEIRLRNLVQIGMTNPMPGKGTQENLHYTADLSIVAQRRFAFLGGGTMRANIPLLLNVTPGNVIRNCSKRAVFQAELGPKVLPAGITRKSGLECVDRGGTPVIKNGDDFYSCRIPITSYGVCGATDTNLPGWFCYVPTDLVATYVY